MLKAFAKIMGIRTSDDLKASQSPMTSDRDFFYMRPDGKGDFLLGEAHHGGPCLAPVNRPIMRISALDAAGICFGGKPFGLRFDEGLPEVRDGNDNAPLRLFLALRENPVKGRANFILCAKTHFPPEHSYLLGYLQDVTAMRMRDRLGIEVLWSEDRVKANAILQSYIIDLKNKQEVTPSREIAYHLSQAEDALRIMEEEFNVSDRINHVKEPTYTEDEAQPDIEDAASL